MKIPELIEKNKHTYGTYSVMALMNINMVLDHIQKLANLDGEMDEKSEDYWEHPVMKYIDTRNFGEDTKAEKLQFILTKLQEYFPFVKVMGNIQRENANKKKDAVQRLEVNHTDVYDVLNCAFRVIKAYRDTSTHFLIESKLWEDGSKFLEINEQRLAIVINKYYEIALRKTKEKYNYTTADLAFIQDFRYKKEKKDGKPRMLPNLEFFLSMQSINGDKTGMCHLSAVGVAQLICLFLEKQYINQFLNKLPKIYGKYGAASEERRIIRRSMAMGSVQLPKDRIRSEKSEMSVALDMLNELKRCPKELFDTLSYEDQSVFRIVSSDYNEVLQKRHSDRFAQLALQYIDYNRMFPRIRFHVNMGKLRYLFSAQKQCIDGQNRVRVIEHPLNGFGRLDEMENKRRDEHGCFVDSGVSIRDFEHVQRDDANGCHYPYVVDTFTHYMLKNNKVEMAFGDILPKIEKACGKWYVTKQAPSCRISVWELPAMIFHMHLWGGEHTEKRIKEVYRKYQNLFAALRDGKLTEENIDSFGIAREDMPQKAIESVTGGGKAESYRSYVKQTVAEMQIETDKLIERLRADKKTIRSSANKMGKRGFRQLSSGKLAEFLAQDIIKFQQSAFGGEDYGIDKMTGLNYRIMQASIATYDNLTHPDAFNELQGLFRKAGLTVRDGKNSHPFLFSALSRRPSNVIELYENYLLARNKYLKVLKERIEKGEKVTIPFVNPDKSKWAKRDGEYYETLGEIYTEDVIELPRQMFDEEIKKKLKTFESMKEVNFEQSNVTYLIAEYMKRVCEDDVQEFYQWKRNYRYIDMLWGEIDAKKNCLCKVYTTIDEREQLWEQRDAATEKYREWEIRKKKMDRMSRRISEEEFSLILDKRLSTSRNECQKSEKTIRRYKVQDALLFLLAKDTLTKLVEFGGKDFKLKEVMPDAEKGLLSEVMPMEFYFEKDGHKYTLHSKGMKVKNYGDFYSLIHDKRLVSLLRLLTSVNVEDDEESLVIEKETLDQEFMIYDTCRPKLIKLVFDFERLAYSRHKELNKLVKTTDHFDFGKLLQELKKRGELTDEETWVLSQIRNAFNHNNYPKEGIVRIKVLPEVAAHLVDIFQEYVKD